MHLALRGIAGFAAAALVLADGARAQEEIFDGVAAQVGSDIVLVSEVNQIAAPVAKRMRDAGVPETEIALMRVDILDRLINQKLLEEVRRRHEISASDTDVDMAINEIATDAGISFQELKQSVTSHGLTFDEYREKIRSEIERSKVRASFLRSKVHVEQDEVEAIYMQKYADQPIGGEEVHLRHLLVAHGNIYMRDAATACDMAAEARTRVESGESSFPEEARRMSDANAAEGGELGWIHARDLAGWMAPAVQGLEPGQVSDVIQTSFGCNLLELVERRKYEPVTLERATPAIERMLYMQKMEEEYTKWVDGLRGQAYIERKGIFRVGGAEIPGG